MTEWCGKYLDEDAIVADLLDRLKEHAAGAKLWLDPWSWKPAIAAFLSESAPEHAGCLWNVGMSIRNFYGMWHASNPYTAFDEEHDDLQIEDGIVIDPRHPDNISVRVIDRVKAELQKIFAEAA